MKILFDVEYPFASAHGGEQVLVEGLMTHLPELGVEVEPLKWWDEKQHGDIINMFYLPSNAAKFAKIKGIKIVSYVYLDGYTSKGKKELFGRKLFIKAFNRVFANYATSLGFKYPIIADAYIYPSNPDKLMGNYLFNAELDKSYVISHGIDDKYFIEKNLPVRSNYLISISTIHERKNNVLLGKIAKKLNLPIIFLGKPYGKNDPYYLEFLSLVDNKNVIYKGFVGEAEKIEYLKRARGFILLSKTESFNYATLEAFALGCPAFLPDLGWARGLYDGYAEFGDLKDMSKLQCQIQSFYNCPDRINKKYLVPTWKEVSQAYLDVYKSIL